MSQFSIPVATYLRKKTYKDKTLFQLTIMEFLACSEPHLGQGCWDCSETKHVMVGRVTRATLFISWPGSKEKEEGSEVPEFLVESVCPQ